MDITEQNALIEVKFNAFWSVVPFFVSRSYRQLNKKQFPHVSLIY